MYPQSVLSKNKKSIFFFPVKISISITKKNLYIALDGHVFVMCLGERVQITICFFSFWP